MELFDGTTKVGEDTGAPFTFDVAFAAKHSGTHIFTARATDAVGNARTSAGLALVVAVPDTTPPTVTLTSSAAQVTNDTTITLTATTADDVGVVRVDWYIGTTLWGTTHGVPPFTLRLPLGFLDNGTRSFRARVADAAGNAADSNTVDVAVSVAWTRVWGSNSNDEAHALALDAQGHAPAASTPSSPSSTRRSRASGRSSGVARSGTA